MKRTVWTLLATGLLLGVAAVAHPAEAAGIHLAFLSTPASPAPGDTIRIDVMVTPADAEFNAFDLNLVYDAARLTFLPTTPVSWQRGPLMTDACANTFHLFTPGSGLLQATLSLLCNNVFVTGPGVIYRVRFIAGPTTGPTEISCGAGTQFYRAGFFVNPLDCQPLLLDIGATSPVPEGGGGPGEPYLGPPSPNPRPDCAGPERIDFRLPAAGSVHLELFDAGGRRLADRPATPCAAGAHQVSWDLPQLASGAYFVRLSTGSGFVAHRTLVVLH